MNTILNITAENFLSLKSIKIELKPLNVLVGPNGAGKTNILKLFQFLGDVARLDLIPAIEAMGDFDNVFFRGGERRDSRGAGRKANSITIGVTGIITQHASAKAPDAYTLSFWQQSIGKSPSGESRQVLRRHEVIALKRTAGRGRRITLEGGTAKILPIGGSSKRSKQIELTLQNTATGLATLRKLGDAYDASGIEALAQVFEQLRLFEIDVERVRQPRRNSTVTSLMPDGANLAVYLHTLRETEPTVFDRIQEDVRVVLPGFRGFRFTPIGGSEDAVRLDIVEDKLSSVTPLARVSFGTIRAIALFTMLNDPKPPKLTCLEEIDHGLHPHALDLLVDRVREASSKTQIILATHSPAFVNRLEPSELIIIERDPDTGGTRVTRPDQDLVKKLQEETAYGLGELWFSGSIGGAL